MRIAMLLLLAGAAAPLAAQSQPPVQPPQLPAFSDAGLVEGQSYELSLDDAIRIARSRSFRIARVERNLRASDLRYDNARAQYYPRADFRIFADQSARGFTYESDRFLPIEQQPRGEFRASGNADVSMPIDVGGVIGRQVRQARAQRDISGREVANAALDVTLEVQTNYLNALRAQNQVDADAGVVREIEQLLARAESAAGALVPFLTVELANARQAVSNARENADRAQDGLKQVLRVPPEARLRLTTDVTDRAETIDRAQLLQRALDARPDIQIALLRVRQAEIQAAQADDPRRPQIRLGAFFDQQFSGRSIIDPFRGDADIFRNQGVGVNVNLPIFQVDFGQLRRNREIALIQREQAAADVQELQERIAYELRQQTLAVARAETRIRNLPDREQAYAALKRAEQAMLAAPADTAQALLAQVTNARAAWRAAETATTEAYIDYNNAVFRLRRSIGDDQPATAPAPAADAPRMGPADPAVTAGRDGPAPAR